jgi:hypothetical protein
MLIIIKVCIKDHKAPNYRKKVASAFRMCTPETPVANSSYLRK